MRKKLLKRIMAVLLAVAIAMAGIPISGVVGDAATTDRGGLKNIDTVSIEGIVAPRVGEKPQVAGIKVASEASYTLSEVWYQDVENFNTHPNGRIWYDRTEKKYMTKDDVFKEDHLYEINIYLAPKSGYKFIDNIENIKVLKDYIKDDVNYNTLFKAVKYFGEYEATGKLTGVNVRYVFYPVHAHKYSSEWYVDEESHWKECSCGLKIEEAKHDFSYIAGQYYNLIKCRVCGKEIIIADISSCDISKIEDVRYTGKAHTPVPVISYGSEVLVKDKDYTVAYSKNKYIGTATVTIKGLNRYVGTREINFKILPKKIYDVKQTDRTTGTIEISWPEQSGGVKYQLYRATSKTGKYTKVISTSKTSYRDSGRLSGKIYYYKVRAYKVVDSKYYYGKYSDVFTASTKCKTPTITVTSPSKGKAKIAWKQIQGADGYQIKIATSSGGKYTTAKTVTSGETTSYTNTGIDSKKTYYYKVRAYKLVDGKKVYSSYSTIKSIKVK